MLKKVRRPLFPNKKSRQMTEYLASHVWSIVSAILILIALKWFGLFNPDSLLPEYINLGSGFTASDIRVDSNSVYLTVQNNLGKAAHLLKINIQICNSGRGSESVPVTVLGGSEAKIVIRCGITGGAGSFFKSRLYLNYAIEDEQTGASLTHKEHGSMKARIRKAEVNASLERWLSQCDLIIHDCKAYQWLAGKRYCLGNDVYYPKSDACMNIDSDNVTLACGGREISSQESLRGNIGVSSFDRSNLRIEGCIFSNFDTAIMIEGGENNTIAGNAFKGNMQRRIFVTSGNSIISNNTDMDTSCNGKSIHIEGKGNILIGNAFKTAIELSSSGNRLENNTVNSACYSGLLLNSAAAENTFIDNEFCGHASDIDCNGVKNHSNKGRRNSATSVFSGCPKDVMPGLSPCKANSSMN